MEKHLFRIKNKDSMLGGVSLGLAEYFETDVTFIRVLFVILFFTPVPSGIIYFVLWAVLPVKYDYNIPETTDNQVLSTTETNNFQTSNSLNMNNQSRHSSLTGGVILIVLGSIFAMKEFFDVNIFHYVGKMWPLFLVGLGVWLIVRERNDSTPTNTNL